MFTGLKQFKVYLDAAGQMMPAPKYVIFRSQLLCGYYDTETEAVKGFHRGDVHEGKVMLQNYLGIDERLRSLP